MQLFVIEDNVAKPHVETLLISPFKEIWERDNSRHKEQAVKEFSYIEFVSSPRNSNPFAGYPEDVRVVKVREAIFKGQQNWRPDTLVIQGTILYNEFFMNASPALSYLKAAKKGADELKRFLENVDLSEKNDKGAPIYKPKDVTSALIDTFNVLKNLKDLEEKMEQELYETTKTKANREINHFER